MADAKSYQDIGDVPPEYDCELLTDYVVELLGQFKKKSAIGEKLREDFPDISSVTVGILISRATAKIRETLNKNPNDYKGRIIECLEQIISGKAMHKDRLKALEMLANYTGVNQAANEEPSEYARRIAEAIKQMDGSVDGTALPSYEKEDVDAHSKQTTETRPEKQEAAKEDATS